MIVFITSLRHPDTANDYAEVERLLADTLASICAQDTEDFRVVVVGHVAPGFALPPKVDFVGVDMPVPPLEDGKVSRSAVKTDKGIKLMIAAAFAKRYDPSHVMIVDADDYVSRRIASFVNGSDHRGGWYVSSGIVLSKQDRRARALTRHFNRRCGSSMIYAMADMPIPDYAPDLVERLFRKATSEIVRMVFGSHLYSNDYFAKRGTPLKPLPFPGAVYVLQTGENHSEGELDYSNPIVAASLFTPDAAMIEEFTLPA
jgi:hypothetical protein